MARQYHAMKRYGLKCFLLGHEFDEGVCVDCTRRVERGYQSAHERARLAKVTLRHYKDSQRRREG